MEVGRVGSGMAGSPKRVVVAGTGGIDAPAGGVAVVTIVQHYLWTLSYTDC